MPCRTLRIAKIILINLLIFLLLLVPLELVFGDWLTGGGDLDLINVRPNTLDVQASPLYPPGTTITYSRDRYGFRGGSAAADKIDVLAIGGSTTNERFVDDRDIWTARLQRSLGERGCTVTIANSGVDGYSTIGHIASFDRWFNHIPGLRPRFVLAYVGVNDAPLAPGAENPADPQKFTSGWRRLEHYIAARSALRRLYVTLRGWWRAENAGVLHGEVPITAQSAWETAPLPDDFAAVAGRRVAAYRQRLARLNGLIHRFGAEPVYITQMRADGRLIDDHWQQVVGSDGAFNTAMLLAIDRATLDFCRSGGETCIDLAGKLRFESGDFYDAVHTTPAGSARIAAFLADALPPILCQGS